MNVLCLFQIGSRFARVWSVENQISRPIPSVKRAATTMRQPWIWRRMRFLGLKIEGSEMRKERHMIPALIMEAVRGHSSRRRLLAMLARVGGLFMLARV